MEKRRLWAAVLALSLLAGCAAGAQAPGGPELAPVAALPQKRLLAWARELEELRRATQFNVGVGHLCGALCAALSR